MAIDKSSNQANGRSGQLEDHDLLVLAVHMHIVRSTMIVIIYHK